MNKLFRLDHKIRNDDFNAANEHRFLLTMEPLAYRTLVAWGNQETTTQIEYHALKLLQRELINSLKALMPEDLKFKKQLDDILGDE